MERMTYEEMAAEKGGPDGWKMDYCYMENEKDE